MRKSSNQDVLCNLTPQQSPHLSNPDSKVRLVENYLIEVERKLRKVKRKSLKSAATQNTKLAICDVVETAADGA